MITPSFGITATERVLPKLALDFTTESLDSRITFTRTTDAAHPATYVNSSGVITAATDNQPRFDYDPVTLACNGLLIEESRTNIVAASQQSFNNTTYWSKSGGGGVTVVDNNVISPDGGLTGSTVTGVASVTTYITSAQQTLTASTNYSFSLFVKQGTAANCRIRLFDGALSAEFAGVVVIFNSGVPSTQVLTGTWVTAPIYQNFGNGWYRVSGVFSSGAKTTSKILFYPDQSAAGANTNIYGAQLEAGAFPTSYIPTTTAALTRNADVAVMTGTNFSDWFTAGSFTLVAKYIIDTTGNASANRYAAYFDNGASANRLHCLVAYGGGSNLRPRCVDDGTIDCYPAAGAFNSQFAFTYATNNSAISVNAGTVTSDTSGTIYTTQTRMSLGASPVGGACLNGHLQKITWFPQRLSNSELQAFSKG